MIRLNKAPQETKLRIIEIDGGYGVRRRLLSMGFHKNDIILLEKRSILGGPVAVRSMSSNTSIALGRGIAGKILVEIVE
jgi:Fe2+ transport system protein FeoA